MGAAVLVTAGPASVAGPAVDVEALMGFVFTCARVLGGMQSGGRGLERAGEADDEGLLAAIGRGDERAFRTFMDRHLDRIHAFAYRFTGKAPDAEDIAQETFLRVWRKADVFKPGGAKPTTWLHTIAANLCIDHARRGKLRQWLPFGDKIDPADNAPSPDTETADRDALRHVGAAIRKLPDRQRLALVLSVTGGHSNPEVAEIMGLSTGAVEQAIFRARKTLRDQFDGKF
ncbi:MAG: sigma-70 family RNA polymerase sigma factor [Tepidamorphaceae bacterium]